jgi:hypothetical protein
MPLTAEQKERNAFERMLQKARQYQTSTYARKFVAGIFQKMIRAEAAADPREYVTAVVDGEIRQVRREIGQVVCITCGAVTPWNATKAMNTGHFVASRRNSILFAEDNVAPQCARCNCYLSGAPMEYRQWMEFVRGREVISELRRLKNESVSFSHLELVDMRMSYMARLKSAEERMRGDL